MKIKIKLESGKAVFHGPMTTEALRSRIEAFEAFTGGLPRVMVSAATVTSRSFMAGKTEPVTTPLLMSAIHRLFVRLSVGKGRAEILLIPEQCPDLCVEMYLTH